MDARPRVSLGSVVTALSLAVVLLACGPASAFAAPAPTSSAIEAKKAEKAAAEAEAARMQADMQAQLQEYAQLGRRIEAAREEVSRVTSETADLDKAVADRRVLLRARAVELYRAEPMGWFAVLLGARGPQDFLLRLDYLTRVSEQDAALVDETTRLYSQNLYLEGVLGDRLKQLVELQSTSDDQRAAIEKSIADAQARAKQLGTDVVTMLQQQQAATTGSSPTSAFDPNTVVSETNFRASRSMDAAAIQTFLNGLPGPLKSYSGPDHTGRTATAAQMIAEASAAWGISPKVILVTLQKEQSLLEKTPTKQDGWDWAMGSGKPDNPANTNYSLKGFGMQIWSGAQKFKQNADLWTPGATQDIDGSVVHPTNPGTHAQYRYTPHFSGVMSFWTLYWRYFGDPLSG